MKNETTLLYGMAIFAILAWILLKDKDEVFLTLALPGIGTVAAGGRNLVDRRTIMGDSSHHLQ